MQQVPTECKWCGAGPVKSSRVMSWFECWTSYDPDTNGWHRANECLETCANRYEQLHDRIRRALDKIKSSKRWSVEATPKTPPEYYPDPDGWIARASDVDEVARILEGDEDGDVS